MIASPSDVSEERAIVTEEIYRWNAANASARHLVLLPIKWETHSTPQMGGSPQSIINRQLLNDADIVIGIFGTKIGTPTDEYVSGTVEEIKRHATSGKTTKVYFSEVPVSPSEVNFDQYASVREFRNECRSMGLYATFRSHDDFRREFGHHLTIELNQGRYLWLAAPDSSGAQPEELRLSSDEKRLFCTAAAGDGLIFSPDSIDLNTFRVCNEEFSDGTSRSQAKWRSILRRMYSLNAIEFVSGDVYRLTGLGYEIADKVTQHELSEGSFQSIQEAHTSSVLASMNYTQRDLLRFLLLKGGSARGDVFSFACDGSKGAFDFNGVTAPLLRNGLVLRSEDRLEGTSTLQIKSELKDLLQSILFPRKEDDDTPYFKGIPVS